MIRKAIIALLSLAAVVTGMISTVAVPGCRSGGHWDFGEPDADAYSSVSAVGGPTGIIVIAYRKFLQDSPPPTQQQWRGTGWLFRTDVTRYEPSGRPMRVRVLVVSWTIPVAMCVLFATYPPIALVCGPLRRFRRRRRGLCMKCGYDLTGNVTGVCPECGTKVERP